MIFDGDLPLFLNVFDVAFARFNALSLERGTHFTLGNTATANPQLHFSRMGFFVEFGDAIGRDLEDLVLIDQLLGFQPHAAQEFEIQLEIASEMLTDGVGR